MKRIVALVSLATLLIGGLLFLLRGNDDIAVGEHDALRGPAPLSAPDVQVADLDIDDAAPATPPTVPLPAADTATADTPLRDMFATLDAAARAGDAHAACRLGAQLSNCTMVHRMARLDLEDRRVEQLAEQAIDDEGMQPEIDTIATRKNTLAAVLEHCEGMTPEMLRNAPDYFTMAAIGGHVPSQVRFLTGLHLHPAALLRDTTPLQTYPATFFRHALEAGDLSLLQIWQFSATPDDGMALTAFLPPEFGEPGLVVALIDRLSEEQRRSVFPTWSLDQSRATPSPEQVRAADVLYRRHFAASEPVAPQFDVTAADGGLQRMLSEAPYRCDEAAR